MKTTSQTKGPSTENLRPVVRDRLDRFTRAATFLPFLPGEDALAAAKRAWRARWEISGDAQLRELIDLDALPEPPHVHDIEWRRAHRAAVKRDFAKEKALRPRQLAPARSVWKISALGRSFTDWLFGVAS